MLKVSGIKKAFADKTVLHDVSFVAHPQTVTVIEGKNGAGKSTLFAVLSGLLREDDGVIMLNDIALTSLALTKRAPMMAVVRQDPQNSTIINFSVLENCALALLKSRTARLRDALAHDVRKRAHEHLLDLGLNFVHDLAQPLSLYSGGQRQMLAFAMATISRPQLLLLDEPTAALDEHAAIQMMDLVKKFVHEWHIPAVMISHDHELNKIYADRIYRLHDGILTQLPMEKT